MRIAEVEEGRGGLTYGVSPATPLMRKVRATTACRGLKTRQLRTPLPNSIEAHHALRLPMQIFPVPFAVPRDEIEYAVSASRRRGPSRRNPSATGMGRILVVQRQPQRPGARDLAASDLHGDVRHDARHRGQCGHGQRSGGEARALSGLRLPSGGGVDRGEPLAFTFDGKPYSGVMGDSIASALIANGVRIVGRSFKYHRPREIWGASTEKPNAIVDVTRGAMTTPNLRATTEALENNLAVRSVNAATDGGRRSRRSSRQALDVPARWILLQDVPLAALGGLRRRNSRHGRTRPRRSA